VLPLTALSQPGASISRGRNEAVRAARGEIIAVIDAGVRASPEWLAELVRPFESADAPDVVGGFFRPDPHTIWELALGVTTLPSQEEIRPASFLPSSRSIAFTRRAWEQVGGYPEWLDYCEDLVFDLALKRAGCRFGWVPGAVVHLRPRANPWRFFLQYYRYARGDGKALLWTSRHLIRYAVYLGAPLALWWSQNHRALVLTLLLAAGLAYCGTPVGRLLRLNAEPARARWLALLLIPLIRLIGDLAKILGYPVGLFWRLTHRGAWER
jgi:cellulose synthase/poly-beta-1,6-N-acetylglucosamine synthase-like glycosyltransferase